MPGGFVVGVHAEANPDIFGMGFGLFTGEALGNADVAMVHERMYLVGAEVFESLVLEKGGHDGVYQMLASKRRAGESREMNLFELRGAD